MSVELLELVLHQATPANSYTFALVQPLAEYEKLSDAVVDDPDTSEAHLLGV